MMPIRATVKSCVVTCQDCLAKKIFHGGSINIDAYTWASDHVFDTGHAVELESLCEIAPEPTGWAAVARK